MATFTGILRPRRNTPPAPATSERFTSGMPNVALREATTRSHASTTSVPPASAGPSTAAMSGFVRSRWVRPAKPPRLVMIPLGPSGLERLEVGAGAEHGGNAGDDRDPHVGVGLEGVDRFLDAARGLRVDRVARLGPIDGDHRGVPAHLVVQHGGDGSSSLASRPVNDFNGKVAIVTGAASGIGLATARALTEAGATVTLADVSDDAGTRAADEMGASYVHLDVSDPRRWAALLEGLPAARPLHLNAGIYDAERSDITGVHRRRVSPLHRGEHRRRVLRVA